MLFRSKIDKSFLLLISFALLVMSAVFLMPLYFDQERSLQDTVIVLLLYLFSAGLILWSSIDIKYVFYPNFLLVKGGLFRSRIPYAEISRVTETNEILIGYRLLSSKDALEVHYRTGWLGSVKISPKDKKGFIDQLQKHCPHITIHISS